MLVVFDMDGVLIDSAALVRDSYRRIGIEPPHDILAQEGVRWLDTQVSTLSVATVKERKSVHYVRGLREGRAPLLPAFGTACRLAREGHEVWVMTGAPEGSLEALQESVDEWPFELGAENIRTPQKMKFLAAWPNTGIYVDDQERLIDLPDGWVFLRYDGYDEQTTYDKVMSYGHLYRCGYPPRD